MLLSVAIVVRVLANPLSNALQKKLTRQGISAWQVVGMPHLALAITTLPWLFESPTDPAAFAHDMLWCTVLAVGCNLLIVEALRHSDLSLLGPLNAWKSVISLLPGALLLGEFPSPLSLVGIGLIATGSYVMAGTTGRTPSGQITRLWNDIGVRYRAAALVLSAIEAVFLKRAVLVATSEATFAWWSFLGLTIIVVALLCLGKDAVKTPTLKLSGTDFRAFLALASTTGLMQYFTLVCLKELPVGSVLALFQTSALVTVVLGHQLFAERNFARRLIGAGFMVAGGMLILATC